ncbi:hypothetical protein Plhal304r1_c028g0093091 [Plasmopara halstedii]
MRFVQGRADPCMFVRLVNDDKPPVYIVLYVDDLHAGCTMDAEADAIWAVLSSKFIAKPLGEARYVLAPQKGELVLRHTHFINRMLERFGQTEANASRHPMVLGQNFTQDKSHEVYKNDRGYRELIGSLLYVANATRPDIALFCRHSRSSWTLHVKCIGGRQCAS